FEINFGADKEQTSATPSNNEAFVQEVMKAYANRKKEDGPAAHQLIGDSHLKLDWRRRKLFLQQTFKLRAEPKHDASFFKPGLCMGIDLGYKIPLYWGLSDLSDAKPLGDKEQVLKMRNQYFNRIRDLQRKVKTAALGGNTAHNKLKELQLLRKKERLAVKQLNRRYAKRLIKIALEKKAGTIILEDVDFAAARERAAKGSIALNEKLTRSKTEKSYPSVFDRLLLMFRNWSYGQLVRFIKEEADKQGILVTFIDPKYTSRVCSVCGMVGNRSSQEFLQIKKAACDKGNCPAKNIKEIKTADERQKKIDEKKGQPYKPKYQDHKISADRNAAFVIAQGGADVVRAKNNSLSVEDYYKSRENRPAPGKGRFTKKPFKGNKKFGGK
ncbi:MAG TPA: zinc ribbon domain-containing protein, partial [Chitinophagales bacterium]|nr:zinc ribbon domain-containing protein [Chitinophagales bacterium]